MSRMLFVNLPVRDLDRAKAFYGALGFSFNPQFTDATAACMVISEYNFVMLLTHEKFAQFTSKPIADARVTTGTLLAIALDSIAAVDDMITAAVKAGGTEPRAKQDHGFMVQRTFEDLDGHTWEPFWMNPDFVQKN